MSNTLKLILVSLCFFILGAVAFFAWSSYTQIQAEKTQLKTQLETAAKTEVKPTLPTEKKIVVPSASPETQSQGGTITGTTGYPASGVPPLEIYAFKEDDHSVYFKTTTQTNQQSFSIDAITPGTYVVVAYPLDTDQLAGGYTKAVACGLSVECTDHSLIPVEVVADQTKTGIEVKDWYAPTGQFPKKP